MAGIFLLRGDDDLVEMTEAPYDSEDVLQELLARYPSLLAGDDERSDRRWTLVAREARLPDAEDGPGRWSVDHLFLDQDGVPTIVEVKRSSDSRIRREVVGQMLDYAANAVVYWPVDRLRSLFERTCDAAGRDAADVLEAHLGGSREAHDFWSDVETNLMAGRVRLVFVADALPTELRRVIEFLNTQMSPAEVIGIEIKHFAGSGLRTLVPRLVGQTAEAQQRKHGGAPRRTDWTWDLYVSELGVAPERVEVGRRLFDAVVAAVAERDLPWQPVFRQGYVAFQRSGGYNAVVVDLVWRKTPRLAVKLPRDPYELGLADPYPDLASSWYDEEREWGWTVPTPRDVPDVGRAIELVRPFHPASGPMVG